MNKGNTIHGHRPKKDKRSKEYAAWSHMRQRCNNPNHPKYHNYGGRGIKVCERWSLFVNFLQDVGFAPSDRMTLERIDNNGGYEPGNVKWATYEDQNKNRRPPKPYKKHVTHFIVP